jgi:hypothetical protein
MDNLPSLNKKIVKVTSLDDIEEEKNIGFQKVHLNELKLLR